MHTLLKPIAAAVLAFAAVGAAQAQTAPRIDIGDVSPGNGHLFFAVWDGVTSYIRGTGTGMNQIFDGVAAPGLYSLSFAADPTFRSWLANARIADIEWGVAALDQFGARRGIDSVSQTIDLANTRLLDSFDFRNYLFAVGNFILDNNNLVLSPTFSRTDVEGTATYAGNMDRFGWDTRAQLPFFRHGTELNNSIETGLNLVRTNGNSTGDAMTVRVQMTDGGAAFPLRTWIDFDSASPTFGQFNVAAVPEPETYAMLLAGLGLMGAIAARRRRQG